MKYALDKWGNRYTLGQDLHKDGIPKTCQWEGCTSHAVRLACDAEGEEGRTHWHGGIHIEDDVRFYCQKHADKKRESLESMLRT